MSLTKEFVLAGRAVFTIQIPNSFREDYSEKHGTEVKPHYTYKVSYKAASDRFGEAYFVQLLTGPDNTHSYSYLGMLDKNDGNVRFTAKSCRKEDDICASLIRRIMKKVWAGEVEDIEKVGFELHNEGKCGRCGRPLTTPESCTRGIGPECWSKMGGGDTVKPIDPIEKALDESEALAGGNWEANYEEQEEQDEPEYDPSNEAEDQALRQVSRYIWGGGTTGPYGTGY